MKKMLFALAAVAALGVTQSAMAATSGEALTAEAKALVAEIQANKKAVTLQTLALNDEQLGKFTPIYDEYLAEQKKLAMDVYKMSNRLYVADYGGMTDVESKEIMKQAFKLREERIKLLEKYAGKLDRQLPATKVFQWVQIENKVTALLDVAAAASIPIVTKTPYRAQ